MKITLEGRPDELAAVLRAVGSDALVAEQRAAAPTVGGEPFSDARVELLRALLGQRRRAYRLVAAELNALPGPAVTAKRVQYFARKHGIRPPISDADRAHRVALAALMTAARLNRRSAQAA